MKRTLSFLFIVLVFFISAFREEMSPIVAGSVSYRSTDGKFIEQVLSSEQLRALSAWVVRSNSGWSRCFITPPDHSLSIFLKHANGKGSSLSLLLFQNSKTTMEARYLSG